jgi:hypothetical protein
MEPRWKPSYADGTGDALEFKDDTFWGYANDLDVWWDNGRQLVIVTGPNEKKVRGDEGVNFDAFEIVDGTLKIQDGYVDLHIDVHDMCLIYALCVEKGALNGKG